MDYPYSLKPWDFDIRLDIVRAEIKHYLGQIGKFGPTLSKEFSTIILSLGNNIAWVYIFIISRDIYFTSLKLQIIPNIQFE